MTVSPGITGNPDSGLENVEKPSLDAANLLILVKKLEGIKDMSERCDVCQEPIEKEKIEPIRVTVHSDRIYDALYSMRVCHWCRQPLEQQDIIELDEGDTR